MKRKLKTKVVKGVTSADTDAIFDAVKELTKEIATLAKTIGEMKKAHDKWIRAGKFSVSFLLTSTLAYGMLC